MLSDVCLLCFQGVMQVEKRLGGRLLDTPKALEFTYGGNNLCLQIDDLCPGWRSKLASNYQVSNKSKMVPNFPRE